MELLELVLFFALCAVIWNVVEWMSAKTEAEQERTRALQLANDKLELEIEQQREAQH